MVETHTHVNSTANAGTPAFICSVEEPACTLGVRPMPIDTKARAAFDLRADRTLTDAEWATMRARLLEFAGILRVWGRTTTASRRGNVEVLCQRER